MKLFLRKLGTGIALASLCLSTFPAFSAHQRAASEGHAAIAAEKPSSLRAIAGSTQRLLPPLPDGGLNTVKSSPSRALRLPAETPRGDLYGIVGSFQGMEYYSQAYLGHIDPAAASIKKLFSGSHFINGQDFDLQGSAVKDGILYICDIIESLEGINVVWRRVVLATGEVLSPWSFGANWDAYGYSMTYCPEDDSFHLLTVDNNTNSLGNYTTVDFSSRKVKRHGHLSNDTFLGAIVYNPADKELYTFGDNNQVYTIDPASGELIDMATVDQDYTIVNNGFTTAMTYSPLDRAFVAFYLDNYFQCTRLLFIDDESFSITETAGLSPRNPYLSSIWCADPFAELDAPAQPAMPVISFVKDSLSGSVTVAAPSDSYGRIPLPASPIATKVTLDGSSIFDGNMNPGESRTFDLNLEEGLHSLSIACSANGLESPVRSCDFFVGNDTPFAPTDLSLNAKVLSWSAPGAYGVNHGYINTAGLTYDIYVDGTRVNDIPVTALSYTLNTDFQQKLSRIEVTASAAGKVSAPASMESVIGNALPLPFSMKPSYSEADLFQSFDINEDGISFQYTYDYDLRTNFMTLQLGYFADADDWLFLPMLHFDSPDVIYNLGFKYANAATYDTSEDLDIYIGRLSNPDGMARRIYSGRELNEVDPVAKTVRFAVPTAGDWFIAFHCSSRQGKGGQGVRLSDFSVKATSESSAVPAEPLISVKPAEKGALQAEISIIAPTEDITGRPLDSNDDISFNVTCGSNTAMASAKPGKTTVATIAVDRSGFAKFNVVGSNSNGVGAESSASAYVGIDKPLAPKNIRYSTSADNCTITISWDKPGEVGQNGGYVDQDALSYPIYLVNGVAFNEVGRTKELSYTYTVPSTVLERYILGPSAINESGESIHSLFGDENLGKPHPIPLVEEFSNTGFSYLPLYANLSGDFNNSAYEATSTVLPVVPNAPRDLKDGGLVVYNTSGHAHPSELVLPKVSTANTTKPAFVLRWLDWSFTPTFSLWGRRYGAEELVKICDIPAESPATPVWRESVVPLHDGFENSPWVDFRVRCNLSTRPEEYGFIDGYSLIQDVAGDLKVADIAGRSPLTIGETADYQVRVINAGFDVISGSLHTTVTGTDGTVILNETDNIRRLQSNQDYLKSISFSITPEILSCAPLTVEATVESDDDMVPDNNSISATIEVRPHDGPVVTDLSAFRNIDRSVDLSWSEPDLSIAGNDSFEMLPAFAITENFGAWKNYDFDGKPIFGINGLSWDNFDAPAAWIAFDAEQMNVMNDARLAPHSGKRYLMARTCQYESEDGEDATQASDWLVSPEVVGGSEVTFWYGTISADYTEYIEVWWSADEPSFDPNYTEGAVNGSFKRLRTFSKEGEESWEFVNFTLPAEARYFALRYASFDSFGAMIDDITYVPVRLSKWVLGGYSVIRNSNGVEETIATGLNVPFFTDSKLGFSAADYNVVVNVVLGDLTVEAPKSNTASVDPTGAEEITMLRGISGDRGKIIAVGHAGESLAIYDASGKFVAIRSVASDRESIPCDKGVFMVKAGNAYAKVIVK